MNLDGRVTRVERALSSRRSTRPLLVWCDEGTDPEQAIRAHLHRCPADTGRSLTLIGWAEPDSPQNWPMPPTRREPPDFDVPTRRTFDAPPMPSRDELAGRKAKEQDSITTFQGEGHA